MGPELGPFTSFYKVGIQYIDGFTKYIILKYTVSNVPTCKATPPPAVAAAAARRVK
jgi:hypothetical protein